VRGVARDAAVVRARVTLLGGELAEERMAQGLAEVDAFGGVVVQHKVDEVKEVTGVVVRGRHVTLKILTTETYNSLIL